MRRLFICAGRIAAASSLILVGTSLLALPAGASPSSFQPLKNGALPSITQQFYDAQVLAVSCPSSGNCTAVGQYQRTAPNGSGELEGFVAQESGGTWAAATPVAPPAQLAGTAFASTPSSDLSPLLESVSCTSVGDCTAVGNASAFGENEAIAATETDGAWGPTVVVPSPDLPADYSDLAAVSCSSAGNCTAAGSYTDGGGFIFTATETSGSWSTGAAIDPPSDIQPNTSPNPYSIACPVAGDCVLVGAYESASGLEGMTATSSNGTFAQAVAAAPPAGSTSSELDGIWCADTSDCVAVGFATVSGVEHGLAVTESAGDWGVGVTTDTDATNTTLSTVQCTDTSDCTAIGTVAGASNTYDVLAVVSSAGAWGTPVVGPSTDGGAKGACSDGACTVAYGTALGRYSSPSLTTFDGTSFGSGTTLTLPSDLQLNLYAYYFGATCPNSSTCEVLGAYLDDSGQNLQPYVATYSSGALSSVTTLDFTEPNSAYTNYVGSISCGAVGDCAALFSGQGYGQELDVQSSGTWGAPTSLDTSEEAASVSCVGTSWCEVVGTDTSAYQVGDIIYPEGFSLTYSSGAWSSSPTFVTNTTNLYGVSCWAVGSCEAVGDVQNNTDYGLSQEVGVELSSGTWQSTTIVAPPYANPNGWTGSLNAIACDSSGRCLAVGGYSESSAVEAMYAVSTFGTWSSASTSTVPAGGASGGVSIYSGVTCSDASDCVAVGEYTDTKGYQQAMYAEGDTDSGDLTAETAETGPYTATTDPTQESTYENGVACMTASNCILVGNYWPNSNTTLPAIAFTGTPPPSVPTHVTATGSFGKVTVNWDPPSFGAVTSYKATVGPQSCTTTALTCTFTGLTDEVTYPVYVSATSAAGTGPISTPIAVTVITTPGVPTNVKVTPVDGQVNGYATVSWTAPTDDGASPIESYLVNVTSSSPNPNDGSFTCSGSVTSCSISLTNGVAYKVSVQARNKAGLSPASPQIATEAIGSPLPPTGVVALAGNEKLTVKWAPPTNDGGAPLTGYTAYAGTQTCTSTTTSCAISSLSNGKKYVVYVRANNDQGHSAASTSVIGIPTSGRPPGPPGPVRSLSAHPSTTSVTVKWKKPSSAGAGISYYAICLNHSATNCFHFPSLTTYTWGALKKGTTYTFSVTVYAVDGQVSPTKSVTAKTKT